MNLKKSVHNALWGPERWEISAHPSDPSVIADGEAKGRQLNEIYSNFSLLFKVIDAKARLSVQVHPNEETCKVTGGEPKTEMWCALSDGPIYAGLCRERARQMSRPQSSRASSRNCLMKFASE